MRGWRPWGLGLVLVAVAAAGTTEPAISVQWMAGAHPESKSVTTGLEIQAVTTAVDVLVSVTANGVAIG